MWIDALKAKGQMLDVPDVAPDPALDEDAGPLPAPAAQSEGPDARADGGTAEEGNGLNLRSSSNARRRATMTL